MLGVRVIAILLSLAGLAVIFVYVVGIALFIFTPDPKLSVPEFRQHHSALVPTVVAAP